MHEDVGELEVPVHDLVLIKGLEGIEDLDEELNGFLFGERFVLFEILGDVAFVAVLEDEVEVVGSLLNVVEFDDVLIIAGLEDLNFVLKEFEELAWVGGEVPLMFYRLMALMAMSVLSSLL